MLTHGEMYNSLINMNLQDKIKLGEEALQDFAEIKKLDISHEGTRTMIVKHILHRIEYYGQEVPEGIDTKEHLKYINK